jgi:hypothetical protein
VGLSCDHAGLSGIVALDASTVSRRFDAAKQNLEIDSKLAFAKGLVEEIPCENCSIAGLTPSLTLINANVTVQVKNGVFTGVIENGKVVSLDEYNKRFRDQPAAR